MEHETNEDVRNFKSILSEICDIVELSPDVKQAVIKDNAEAFANMIKYKEAPEHEFDALGHGSFKEAFLPFGAAGKFVIKFATEDNPTNQEMKILKLAEEQGVSEFFIPTIYMSLHCKEIEASIIDAAEQDDDPDYGPYIYTHKYTPNGENYTIVKRVNEYYIPPYHSAVCVQPFAEICYDAGTTPIVGAFGSDEESCRRYYAQHPLMANGSPVEFEIAEKLGYYINELGWWQAGINIYGLDKCLKLVDFIDDNCIVDLHNANIGFMYSNGVKKPVILDWLSD